MKSFFGYFAETLNPEQANFIRSQSGLADPDVRSVDFSNHMFSPDATHKGIVLDRDSVVWSVPDHRRLLEPESDIRSFLTRSGYRIHDYEKGLAVREGGNRPISIGKILNTPIENATNPRLSELTRKMAKIQYETSDIRAAMRTPMEIMITRDPLKVAQMSSGGRWSSCLTLGTCPEWDMFGRPEGYHPDYDPTREKGYRKSGINLHRLLEQIKGGAHAAYLISKGDYDLKNPFARITLRPYYDKNLWRGSSFMGPHGYVGVRNWSSIQPEHTILVPSAKTYTSNSLQRDAPGLIDNFRYAVLNITRSMFPRHTGKSYYVDPLMYNEAQDKQEIGPGEFEYHQDESSRDMPRIPKLKGWRLMDV